MQPVTEETKRSMPRFSLGMILVAALVLATASCREQSRTDAMAEGARLSNEGNAKGAAVIYKTLLERDPKDNQARMELAKAYFAIGKADQAGREIEQLAALAEPPAGLHLLRGKVLVAQGKTDEALKALADHLAKDPDSADAWEYVGHAHVRARDLAEAADAYEHALSADPDRTRVWVELVATRIAQKQLPEAQAQVEALLAAHPDDQAGLHLLAQIQTMNNDMAAAQATFAKISAQHPGDIKARYNEAFILLATKGLSEKVEKASQAMVRDFPEQPEGYKLLGLVGLAKNNAAQAVENLERALRLRPEPETRFFLAQAYERNGNLETAVSELRKVLENHPRHARARQMLASLNLRMNRTDEAIAELEKLLQYDPDNYESMLTLGDIFLSRKDYAKSLTSYQSIPDDVPQAAAAHLKKAIVLGASGKPDQAEAEMRTTMRLAPAFLEARLALVALLKQQQRLDEAEAVLEAPGLRQTDAAQAMTVRGALLFQQGREDEAVVLLEKAKAMSPGLAPAYYTLAKIYSQKMEPEKAMDQYRQLLVQQPQSVAAHTALAAGLECEGKFDEAKRHLEQAAASKQLEPYLRLADFLARRNQAAAATEVLDQCLREHQNALPALLALSRVQLAAGDEAKSLAALGDVEAIDPKAAVSERIRRQVALKQWDQAEAEAGRLIELNAGSAGGQMVLASIKTQRGDLPGAERVLRQALAAEPSALRVRLELAGLLMQAGKAEEAGRLYEEAIAKSANPAEAYAARGLAWQTAGKHEAAIKDYEAALKLQANMPMVLNNLSMLYADRPAQAGKGLQYALAANALAENNPFVLDTLGYALLKNGRHKDAKAVLQRAAILAPQNREIAQHLEMADSTKK